MSRRTAGELHELSAELQEREQVLARRARDLTAAEVRLQAEYDALAQMRLSLEAEHESRPGLPADGGYRARLRRA